MLVHVAVAIAGAPRVQRARVDYGVFWVSRRQAQNAADAAAHAGALSLGVRRAGRHPRGPRRQRRAAASANHVWGEAPRSTPATDVSSPCLPGRRVFPTLHPRERLPDAGRGNPLPTFFAQLVGITSQGVRATATAQVIRRTRRSA